MVNHSMTANTASEPVPDLKGLMSLVGYLLLRWGILERQLNGRSIPADLQHIQALRNTLCHGMFAARADPHGEGVAHITCRARDGSALRITAAHLEDAIRELEQKTHLYGQT